MDQTIVTDQVSEQDMLVDGIMGHSEELIKFKYLYRINFMEWLIYIFEIESTKLLLVDSLKSIELQHYEEIITNTN